MILTSSCVALSVSNSLCSVAFSWLSFCSRASRSINAAPRSGSGWVCVWHASSRSCFFSLSKICWIFCGSPLQIENKCWHVGVRKERRLRWYVNSRLKRVNEREMSTRFGNKTTRATHFRSCPVMPALLAKASQAKFLCIGHWTFKTIVYLMFLLYYTGGKEFRTPVSQQRL